MKQLAQAGHGGWTQLRWQMIQLNHTAPAGQRTFMFWQEEAGYLREVTVGGRPQIWQPGIAEFNLDAGANDLG